MLRPLARWKLSLCRRCMSRCQVTRVRHALHRRITADSRPFSTYHPLSQAAPLDSQIPSGDILPFEGPPIRYEPSDEPSIRYEPGGEQSHAQRNALRHALGIDVLGTEAEVLVCKPTQRRIDLRFDKDDNGHRVVEGETDIDAAEMLSRIEQERSMTDPDDARLNIEHVRDTWVRENSIRDEYIGDEDYDDLVERLCNGFNKIQLLHYLDVSGQEMQADVNDLSIGYTSETFSRSAWQTGASSIQHPLAMPIKEVGQPVTKQSYYNYDKASLAEAIISDSWSIRRLSREREEGELEMRLTSIHFDLLLGHRKQILKNTSEKYGVKLEVWKPRNTIRISASRDVCADIFRLLKFIIDNMQQQSILLPANCADMDEPSRSVLVREIESITSTKITATATGSTPSSNRGLLCAIEYLGPDKKDLEDAQKMLSGRLPVKDNAGAQLEGHRGSLSLMPFVSDFTACLPVQDRVWQWNRVFAVPKRSSGQRALPSRASNISPVQSAERLFPKVKQFVAANGRPPQHEKPETLPYWKVDVTLFPTVAIGQVVFSESGINKFASIKALDRLREQIEEIEAELRRIKRSLDVNGERPEAHQKGFVPARIRAQAAANEMNSLINQAYHERRTEELSTKSNTLQALERSVTKEPQPNERRFLPVTPGVTSVMARLGSRGSSTSKTQMVDNSETISITLLPTLKEGHSTKLLNAVPLLQIQCVLMKDTAEVELAHVRLTPGPVNLDVLFPDRAMDVRVSQYRSYRSKKASVDPAITRFLDESNLNVYGDERLTTPQTLELQVPRFMLNLKQSGEPDEDKLSEYIDVTYVFRSLEIKSTLRVPYAFNTVLTQTTIEAGRLGGRREELVLQLPPPGSEPAKNRSASSSASAQAVSDISREEIIRRQTEETTRLWHAAMRLMDELEQKPVMDEDEVLEQIRSHRTVAKKETKLRAERKGTAIGKKTQLLDVRSNKRSSITGGKDAKKPSRKAKANSKRPTKVV